MNFAINVIYDHKDIFATDFFSSSPFVDKRRLVVIFEALDILIAHACLANHIISADHKCYVLDFLTIWANWNLPFRIIKVLKVISLHYNIRESSLYVINFGAFKSIRLDKLVIDAVLYHCLAHIISFDWISGILRFNILCQDDEDWNLISIILALPYQLKFCLPLI